MTRLSGRSRTALARAPRRWGWPGVLLLVLGAGGLPAQQGAAAPRAPTGVVVGRVVDEAGQALAVTTVLLHDPHRVTQTHDDGAFRFLAVPPGRYEVEVLRIGFHSERRGIVVVAGDTVRLTITLHPAAVQLSATVVTGALSERAAKDAPVPVSVLAQARLDRKLEATVAGTLAGEPGVAMSSLGPATGRPVLRGLSGDRVLILEDGLRPGDLAATSADHAVSIDPLTARQIEVVRGPMSLLYGASALGGVVNVIREEVPTSLPEHLHGQVSVQAASVNRGGVLGGAVTLPVLGLAVRAEATGRVAGDLRAPVGTLPNTGIRGVGGSLAASKVFDGGHVGVSYRGFGTDYGLPGGFVGAHPNGVDITMRRHMVRAEGERRLSGSPWSLLKGSLAFTDYGHEERESSGRIGTSFAQLMTAGELQARHAPWGPFTQGVVGVRGQYRDITTGGSLRTPSTADWSLAAFWVEEAGRGPVRLQAGLRYEAARFIPLEPGTVDVLGELVPVRVRDFGAMAGSVGVLWLPSPTWRLGASVARAFRVPDFNELYSDGPHLAAYSYDVGNPALGAEAGVGVDLFARYEGEGARAEVAVFRNAMSGYVFPRNTGEIGRQGLRWKFQYTGRDALLSGAEGAFEVTVRRDWVVEGTASYVRGVLPGARDTIPALGDQPALVASRELPLLPPLHGTFGVRRDSQRWFAGISTRLSARQGQLGDFETVTAGYALLGAQAGLRILVGERFHTITVRVDNALDAEVRDHLNRTKDVFPEPGRNLQVLYRVQF